MASTRSALPIDLIVEFLVEELGAEEDAVRANQSLFKSARLQSIDFLMMIAFLEDEFGVSIEESVRDADHMDTLEQIGFLVAERKKG